MKSEFVLRKLKSLTPQLVRKLSRAAFGKSEPNEELSSGQLLFFRFADVVARMRALPEDRQEILLEELCSYIINAGDELAKSESPVPSYVVGIGNRIWACISGKADVLCLVDGRWSPQPTAPQLEMIYYSLTTLWMLPIEVENEADDNKVPNG